MPASHKGIVHLLNNQSQIVCGNRKAHEAAKLESFNQQADNQCKRCQKVATFWARKRLEQQGGTA